MQQPEAEAEAELNAGVMFGLFVRIIGVEIAPILRTPAPDRYCSSLNTSSFCFSVESESYPFPHPEFDRTPKPIAPGRSSCSAPSKKADKVGRIPDDNLAAMRTIDEGLLHSREPEISNR